MASFPAICRPLRASAGDWGRVIAAGVSLGILCGVTEQLFDVLYPETIAEVRDKSPYISTTVVYPFRPRLVYWSGARASEFG